MVAKLLPPTCKIDFVKMQHNLICMLNISISHDDLMMLHVNIIMLHIDIIMLNVDINNLYVPIKGAKV